MKCKNCKNKDAVKYSKYSKGEFCSKSCANSYSTRRIRGKKKNAKCKKCGKKILVGVCASVSNVLCEKCSTYKKLERNRCKYCGQLKCNRPDICKKYQIFPSLIKYFGFNKDTIGTEKLYEEYQRIKDLLYEEYHIKKLSVPQLADKYKHKNKGNLSKIMQSLDINFRTLSESNSLGLINGRKTLPSKKCFKHGYHKTWNKKKVFYRSSYELDYCKELDKDKIDYDMENLKILYWDSQQQKQRIAIPDFYLPETNTIVEIKSNYTYDEQNMKDKVKEYKKHGYKFKLILEHKEVVI